MKWDSGLEQRLRARYVAPRREGCAGQAEPVLSATGLSGGVLVETARQLMFAAPASSFDSATDLPPQLAASWEAVAGNNPYMSWIQGRYVEAEAANRNGAFWSTGDLEFGEMGVKHGPLNWLHQGSKVVGAIADAKLIKPEVETAAAQRPFIATVSSIWRWLYPGEAAMIQKASDDGRLFASMECVAEQMQCLSCQRSFPYVAAMTGGGCEHINARSAPRRLINPSFLGGAVIVPPVEPGWAGASARVIAAETALAASTFEAADSSLSATQWESLMSCVLSLVRD